MRYNLSKIMLKAWKVYRKTKGISFAEVFFVEEIFWHKQ